VIDLGDVLEQAICHAAAEELPQSKSLNFIGIESDGADARVDGAGEELSF
jgi:hypothetical protein